MRKKKTAAASAAETAPPDKKAGKKSRRHKKLRRFKVISVLLVIVLGFGFIYGLVTGFFSFHDFRLYVTTEAQESDIHSGTVILVNSENAFDFTFEDTPVNVGRRNTASYLVRDKDFKLSKITIQALNTMFDDFCAETGVSNVCINSAYRSMTEQQEIYDDRVASYGWDYANEFVASPGYSEHHTGLACDLAVLGEDDEVFAIGNIPEYEWIIKNCANYGFILRYPDDKTDITGISTEPWHFRYVGVPHSRYIMQNGLCLEEYIALLDETGVSNQLTFSDGESEYHIYLCKDGKITRPLFHKSVQSGNNRDGVIIAFS